MSLANRPPDLPTTGPVAQELRAFFKRNGYVRKADLKRRKKLTSRAYKKGWEARIIVRNEGELQRVRELLREAGFGVAKPFRKAKRWAQPVYGRFAVKWFTSRRGE